MAHPALQPDKLFQLILYIGLFHRMPLNEMVLLVKLNLRVIVLYEFYLIKIFRFNIGTERYSVHNNAFFLTLTSFYPEIIFIICK